MRPELKEHRTLLIALAIVVLVVLTTTYLYRLERRHQEELREASRQTIDMEASELEARSSGRLEVRLSFYRPRLLADFPDLLYSLSADPLQEPDPRLEELVEHELRSIFLTDDTILTARQIVHEVLKGPASSGLRIFSEQARLRQIYLLEDGTALLDLSREILHPEVAGISTELAALHSLSRSITENVPEIRQVRFLVEGEERATLAGHVSIREPFQ